MTAKELCHAWDSMYPHQIILVLLEDDWTKFKDTLPENQHVMVVDKWAQSRIHVYPALEYETEALELFNEFTVELFQADDKCLKIYLYLSD